MVSAKNSKVGKGEWRVLEAREAPAGKAAYSQARKVILTGLTHGSHTLHTPAPHQPPSLGFQSWEEKAQQRLRLRDTPA